MRLTLLEEVRHQKIKNSLNFYQTDNKEVIKKVGGKKKKMKII